MSRRKRDTAPTLFSLACENCGAYLVSTESGFLSCPHGHGRLVEQQDEPPELDEGSLFDPSDLDTGGCPRAKLGPPTTTRGRDR